MCISFEKVTSCTTEMWKRSRLDGVTFRQNSKDAFGKPVERVVTKRIYASAGEQQ